MNKKDYDAGYYLDMLKVMEKTEGLMEQHPSIECEELKWSIMELISIYYSKPFISSNRAYKKGDESKHRPHKLLPEEITFTEKEREIHDLAYDWRNGYIAHSDQEKRNQELSLKRDKDGKIVGFESVSSSEIMPIFDFHFETLKRNIAKIKDLLWYKIYT